MIVTLEIVDRGKLGERTGLRYSDIRKALYNENPSAYVVEKLARYFGISMDDMMESIRVYQRRRVRYGEDYITGVRDPEY